MQYPIIATSTCAKPAPTMAVDHPVDRAADDFQQAAGQFAGDAVKGVAQRLHPRRPIAVEEEADDSDQRELYRDPSAGRIATRCGNAPSRNRGAA